MNEREEAYKYTPPTKKKSIAGTIWTGFKTVGKGLNDANMKLGEYQKKVETERMASRAKQAESLRAERRVVTEARRLAAEKARLAKYGNGGGMFGGGFGLQPQYNFVTGQPLYKPAPKKVKPHRKSSSSKYVIIDGKAYKVRG